MVNAKELHRLMVAGRIVLADPTTGHPHMPADQEIAHRALSLLAAAEASDGTTPETDAHATPYNEDGTDWIRADFARRLEQERNAALRALEMARHALAEIREEWAGAECGEPVTAQEGYAIGLAKRMYQLAVEGLK